MNAAFYGKNLRGAVAAIPSKSVCHRLLICAALSDTATYIECSALSRDITATAACLSALGAQIAYDGKGFTVSAPVSHNITDAEPDCGESGSTLRFLLPVAAALGAQCRFKSEGRLPSRPLEPLYGELLRHGAALSPEGKSPLSLSGRLSGGRYTLSGSVSSQFISGLLFALPLCAQDSEIVIDGTLQSAPYVDMTLDALAQFGVSAVRTDSGFSVPGGQHYRSPGHASVEGDWSNAAFWLSAAALGADIEVTGLRADSLQGDRRVTRLIEDIKTGRTPKIDAGDVPDLVPVLAVLAAAGGGALIYNAARLRLKESDRLSTVSAMLRALGAGVTEGADYLEIPGGGFRGETADFFEDNTADSFGDHTADSFGDHTADSFGDHTVDSFGDHRIAMAAAIASVHCGSVTVRGFEAADKSYPGFIRDFQSLGGEVITD